MAQADVQTQFETLTIGRVFTDPDVPGLRIKDVDASHLRVIGDMNRVIFNEERIINSFNRDDLLMLVAYLDEEPVGFKVGYAQSKRVFYSAKGGVLPPYRRRGIAKALLYVMLDIVRERGYKRFTFDTFPNRHPGMVIMGLTEGFKVIRADYNPTYKDYRLRLAMNLE